MSVPRRDASELLAVTHCDFLWVLRAQISAPSAAFVDPKGVPFRFIADEEMKIFRSSEGAIFNQLQCESQQSANT